MQELAESKVGLLVILVCVSMMTLDFVPDTVGFVRRPDSVLNDLILVTDVPEPLLSHGLQDDTRHHGYFHNFLFDTFDFHVHLSVSEGVGFHRQKG